ncbi:unnamed protein product [Euphydryas editha]|uniref:UDP-glucuronosyltransferase n=1 Tax=Euphydryas editha TaxID=104508 RepID=A0AAU9UGR6_EUPED|nr:unnamed protein product [Euphydryas editha]
MFKLIIIFTYVLVGSKCSKILGVFPFPSISHQVVFRSLMHELANRGHEVTVITPDPAFPKDKTPRNLTEIDVHDVSYPLWNELIEKKGNQEEPIVFGQIMSELVLKIVAEQLKSPAVQQLLRENKQFDLIFIESFIRPALIYSHIYNNAPIIEFSSGSGYFSTFEKISAATHPIHYPIMLYKRINNLSFLEKLSAFYIYYFKETTYSQHLHTEDKVMREILGPSTPSIKEIEKNVQMFFFNVHTIWDLNRPVPPNVIYLGGLHQRPEPNELPKDLKSYLDSSKNGVIYVSFGTNIKPWSFSPDELKIFTDAFGELPFDVLWKWDNDELPEHPKNVKISKWLPQADLLRHQKIKVFITQGGLQSTDEALTAGVPLIGIPMLGDQWYNVERYVKLNIGKGLLMETISKEKLIDTIQTVIENRSFYQENIIKLRNIMHDQPQPPLQRAVYWTEYVLRHGGEHLRAPTAHMSLTEYYELELVLMMVAAVLISLLVSILITCFVISKIKSLIPYKVKFN